MKKFSWLVFAILGFTFTAQPVLADAYGLANGRSANMDNLADMSVEGGFNLEGDITTIALRFNYKATPDIMVFGDVGQVKFSAGGGSDSGTGFGFGAYYQLRNVTLIENTDFAIKGSYHTASIESIDLSEIAIEALISGDQLATTSLGWYANVGMHILSVEFDFGGFGGSFKDDSNELIIGGGVTGSLSFGDWYAGIDMIDELFLVGGIRYNIQ